MKKYETDVCIIGGGPAGIIAALLLSKAGLRTLVLEQHRDFSREYRGEVLMPRFTQMMRQIGLFSYLETCPHLKMRGLEGFYHNRPFIRLGIDQIAPEAPFTIWMPQTVMLEALYQKCKEQPTFDLWFNSRPKNSIEENGKIAGVIAEKDHEEIEVRAKVVVGADGRFSSARHLGGFELSYESHAFDLVWFTVPQPAGYDQQVRFYLSEGRNYLVLPKYPHSLQVGVVVAPGEFSEFHKKGIDSFRQILLQTRQPLIQEFAKGLKDFHPFNILQAKIERVKTWARDGMVLIGDAAHTCSPAGAIGVSVAVATAIVAAEVIRDCFRKNDFSKQALGKIQEIREPEVLEIHRMQETFSGLLRRGSPWMRNIATPAVLFLLSRAGLFRKAQRRLMVMEKPLPVSKDLGFS